MRAQAVPVLLVNNPSFSAALFAMGYLYSRCAEPWPGQHQVVADVARRPERAPVYLCRLAFPLDRHDVLLRGNLHARYQELSLSVPEPGLSDGHPIEGDREGPLFAGIVERHREILDGRPVPVIDEHLRVGPRHHCPGFSVLKDSRCCEISVVEGEDLSRRTGHIVEIPIPGLLY